MTLDTLGGYRLIRKLGEGPRAELFLAHPESDAELARPTAIKVYRAGVTDQSVIAEAEALSRAAGDHVVALSDLAMGPTGVPALILDRLPGGSLSRLLRDRASLSVGEAVTILAPLALTLDRLHRCGVSHGGVRLDAVSFDATGAPVLACFSRARLFTPNLPPAGLEAQSGIADDLRAFGRIASTVLDRLPVPAALPEQTGSQWLETVTTYLFDLGHPEPVRLRPDDRAREVPSRLVTAHPGADPGAETIAERAETMRSGRLAAHVLPEWLDVPSLVDRLTAIRTALSAVRPRVWAMTGTVGVALMIAVVVVPGPAPAATGERLVPATASTDVPGVDEGPVSGDDPVLALPVLLETRLGCIRDLSVLCLDAVDQAGSAALAHDQQLVREVRDGVSLAAPITVNSAELSLEERLGDSALISLGDVADGEPASILLMKGEAGWRIRDFLEW